MYVVYQLWEILKTCLKSILYIFYIFVTRCASFCHSKFWICGMYMVKVTFVQALRLCTGRTAHRGSRGIAILFHDHSTRRGWGVNVTPRPLFTPEKTRYPLYRWLGGPQERSGQVRKISPLPGFDPRTVQPVASRYTDYATRPTNLRYGAWMYWKRFVSYKFGFSRGCCE